MLFWMSLLIGGGFAWLGLKKGFYVFLTTLLCLMIGIYIGVLSTPRVINMSPEYRDSSYYAAITMLVLSLVVFAVLEGIAWFVLLYDREDYFPKAVEKIGGALCGFLFGYFLLGLVTLSICVMPFSREKIPGFLPQRENMARFGSSPVLGLCGFIGAYSLECFAGEPQAVVETLLQIGQAPAKAEPAPKKSVTQKKTDANSI